MNSIVVRPPIYVPSNSATVYTTSTLAVQGHNKTCQNEDLMVVGIAGLLIVLLVAWCFIILKH
jgi:hypothetical protein